MRASSRTHKSVAGLLAAGLLLFLAATTGLTVAHEIKHAHHMPGMHGTGLCAWLCAAGQGVQADALWLDGESMPLRLAAPGSDGHRASLSLTTHLSRGPPSFLL